MLYSQVIGLNLSRSYFMFARDIKLLLAIKCEISNSIVRECLSSALSNSNTVIGYKLAFYRENLILVF